MKRLYPIFLIILGFFTLISCEDDNSFAITQQQLLSAQKWQLKEIRTQKNNVITTDKLLACERQSTLDFTDPIKFFSVAYATAEGKCIETATEGTYDYQTAGKNRRMITLKPLNYINKDNFKYYYMNQLDPKFLILQDTLQKATETEDLIIRLNVYEPVKM